MRYVDCFFNTIISIQEFLESFEKWYSKKRTKLSWVYILSIIGGYVLIVGKLVVIGELVFVIYRHVRGECKIKCVSYR